VRKLLYTDVTLARSQLMRLTETIELSPVHSNKTKCLEAIGRLNVVGLLGLTDESSTRSNSGGGLCQFLEELEIVASAEYSLR